MKVKLERVEDVAKNIRMFWFRPPEPVDFVAGQFTQVYLPVDKLDERGNRHWFTISSSPTEELIGLTTKFAPNHGSAFKAALEKFQPGDELTLSHPLGDFVLPKDKSIPLLFVAGGIGITPFRSMVKWLTDVSQQRDIHLVYSVRTKEELAFTDIFGAYDMEFTPVVTEPDPDWQGKTGVLTAERIKGFMEDDPGQLVYTAGPEPMVEAFVDGLQKLGVSDKRLVTDYFPGYDAV